jgi:hypothetical protein
MEFCHAKSVPLAAGVHIGPCVAGDDVVDKPFRSLVGCLLYPSQWCRPDLAYSVGALSQVMAGASQQQWKIGLDVVRYLKGAKDKELTYRHHPDSSLADVVAYADSDFANDATTGKSIYGYVIYVAGNAVSWKSKRAQTTATSTTIAELDAVYHCATDCKWISEFLVSLGYKEHATFKIYCDNQAAVKVLIGEKYLDRTKHETVKIEYLRDLIRDGSLTVEWIGTDKMVADGLTKGLNRNKFEKFVGQLGLQTVRESEFRGSVEPNNSEDVVDPSDSGFRGSVEVNPDHEWIRVEGRKKRKKPFKKKFTH